jgi:diguanylate cyclase
MPDNFQQSMKLCNEAQKFMQAHTIAPTPIHYSVIYLYVAQEYDKLTQAVDEQIENIKPLDSVFLENLFNEFLSNTQNIDDKLFLPFEKTLSNTLDQLDSHTNNEQEVMTSLGKIDKALSKLTQFKPLRNIVTFLLNAVGQSQKQRKILSSELNKTSEEVNQLKVKLAESRQEALVDALTGLLNRRGCEKKLAELSLDEVHSSMVLDIDHFKKVNDTFGHGIGDVVIQRVASIIKKHVSTQDISVRYGGEEFVVIFPNKSLDIAHKIAEKIRTSVSELKLVQRQSKKTLPPITVSIGIAELEKDMSWKTLFNTADQALYRAKNSGRNCSMLAEHQFNAEQLAPVIIA